MDKLKLLQLTDCIYKKQYGKMETLNIHRPLSHILRCNKTLLLTKINSNNYRQHRNLISKKKRFINIKALAHLLDVLLHGQRRVHVFKRLVRPVTISRRPSPGSISTQDARLNDLARVRRRSRSRSGVFGYRWSRHFYAKPYLCKKQENYESFL